MNAFRVNALLLCLILAQTPRIARAGDAGFDEAKRLSKMAEEIEMNPEIPDENKLTRILALADGKDDLPKAALYFEAMGFSAKNRLFEEMNDCGEKIAEIPDNGNQEIRKIKVAAEFLSKQVMKANENAKEHFKRPIDAISNSGQLAKKEIPAHPLSGENGLVAAPGRMVKAATGIWAGITGQGSGIVARAQKLVRDSGDRFIAGDNEYSGAQVAMKMGVKRIAIENVPTFKGKDFNILNAICYTDTPYAGLLRKNREPYFHISGDGRRTRLFEWILQNMPVTKAEYEEAKKDVFARHIPPGNVVERLDEAVPEKTEIRE